MRPRLANKLILDERQYKEHEAKGISCYHRYGIVNSRIQNVTPRYTEFENVLPEELSHTQITEELEETKNEINNIIEEDLKKYKEPFN